jgi:hypothetical protein
MQQVHSLTITVAAHYNVPYVVDHTAQLQSGRFTAKVLVLEVLCVWYQIASISNDEHVPDMRLCEPCGQHP